MSQHRYLMLFLFFLACPAALRATHIVGGEINYTCLGGNEYEINLVIFRDCFFGNPLAWFDDPASIGIFDQNNQLVEQLLLPLMNNDTLNPVLTGECFVVPPNVCVHTTTYSAIVVLPPIPGGYQLAYQRCCRNETIVNIVDPLSTGATYSVTISEAALAACNSSPKFKDWPPIYICVNEPIVFDQSAIDQDGDSIVYRLCTPLTGATPLNPRPQPPNNPPYAEVVWVDPPYNLANMLNGSPGGALLQINPQTGLLTGLPNTIGQFVVGICADEYRDGELIATSRRDFQYNVGLCGEAASAFSAPEVQCGSLTVNFENESVGASNFVWLFNDPANPGASSTLTDAVYTFPDTGRYTVQLIAAPGEPCEDTAALEIYLQPETLVPDFELMGDGCTEVFLLEATDLSRDTLHDIISQVWEIEPGGLTADGPSAAFSLTENGDYTLRLTVTSAAGCTATIERPFTVELLIDALSSDSLSVCLGDSVALNPGFNAFYDYQWAPNADIADPNSPNPVVSPGQSTDYAVTVTNELADCTLETVVNVFVAPPLQVELTPDTVICEQQFELEAFAPSAIGYSWYDNPNFTGPLGNAPTVSVSPMGAETYYLVLRDSFGCLSIDSVQLTGHAVDIVMAGQPAVCPDELGAVAAINLDPADTLSYQWSPDSLIIFGANNATAFVRLRDAGIYWMQVELVNQHGCSRLDSISLTLIDTLPQLDFQMAQQCSGYEVQFSSSSINAPFYQWDFGDPDAPGASASGAAVSHAYSGPGTYEVVVVLEDFIDCGDTLRQLVTVEEPNIVPDFTFQISACTDSVTLQFTDASVNSQSDILSWEWDFGNGQSAVGPNPSLVLTGSQQLEVQLTITSSDGCVDEVTQTVLIEVPELDFPDSLLACPGQALALNPNPLPGYTYTWSPPDGLDDPSSPNPVLIAETDRSFSVVLEEIDGLCRFERELQVSVSPPISYSLTPDTLICEGELLLSAESEQDLAYLWSANRNFSSPLGSGPQLSVSPLGQQLYYLQLTDSNGCSRVDSVEVEGSRILVFVDPAQSVCQGDTVNLEVIELAGGQDLSYDWEPDEAILQGQGTASVQVVAEQSQAFTVMISDGQGCVRVETINVSASSDQPFVEAFAEPDTIFGPEQVQLLATLNPAYTYSWSPLPGLSNSTIYNPQARVDSTTTYRVRVTDNNGCSNEALVTITLFSECVPPYIFVPNAFTPNGDGLNDRLLVLGNTIDELYFAIYDRWGELVFETDNQLIGWDGTFRGRELSPDAYGYYLEARCFNGETYTAKGNITLIR